MISGFYGRLTKVPTGQGSAPYEILQTFNLSLFTSNQLISNNKTHGPRVMVHESHDCQLNFPQFKSFSGKTCLIFNLPSLHFSWPNNKLKTIIY